MTNEELEELEEAEAEPEESAAPLFKPAAELRPEGGEGGGAEVGFSASRRQCYHLERRRAKDGGEELVRVYHEVPEGFEFDSTGRLKAKGE